MTEMSSARAMRLNPVVREDSEDKSVQYPSHVPAWVWDDSLVVTKRYWVYDRQAKRFVPTSVISYPEDTPGVRMCNGN